MPPKIVLDREETMKFERLYEQLKYDEGVVYEIYKDHLGYPTFGVGHLVLESDPEYGEPVGTPVSEERVTDCFRRDSDIACLLYTSPSPRDATLSRMPSSA